jgi:hypothetical protein
MGLEAAGEYRPLYYWGRGLRSPVPTTKPHRSNALCAKPSQSGDGIGQWYLSVKREDVRDWATTKAPPYVNTDEVDQTIYTIWNMVQEHTLDAMAHANLLTSYASRKQIRI